MELVGTLSNLAVFGAWAKGILTTGEGVSVRVVGRALVGLAERQPYVMRGQTRHHPQYGPQFEVEHARLNAQVSKDQLLADLRSHYAGCGEKTARRILASYEARPDGLQELASILTLRPWELEHAEDITGKKLVHIGSSLVPPETRALRSVEARLGSSRFPQPVLRRLVDWGIRRAPSQPDLEASTSVLVALAEDPFWPMLEVEGYAFGEAQAVAKSLGVPHDGPARLAALAYEALRDGCERGGHSHLPEEEFRHCVRSIDERASPGQCLSLALARGWPIARRQDRIYLKTTLRAEQCVARAFAALTIPDLPLWVKGEVHLEERLVALEQDLGFSLDISQRAAVLGILTSRCRLHTLTAGPGRGKTTVMELIAALASDVRFAAPTGIAAKVLDLRVRKYHQAASTLHALLESTGESFGRTATNPIDANLIVVDEAGMLDLFSCAALVDAMTRGAHLLLVGDPDQLDSVGMGRVLLDAMALSQADHHRLESPHRADRAVLEFVDGLRGGAVGASSPDGSVTIVGEEDLPPVDFNFVADLWLQSVSRRGLESVALLFPYRKGSRDRAGLNVTYANAALQNLVNEATEQNRIPGLNLRIEDRVIVRKNIAIKRRGPDAQDEIYARLANGDTGYLRGYRAQQDGSPESLQLRMDDGRDIDLPASHMSRLDLAYAQTVHSAQGSEYDEVIFVLGAGGGNDFLNRRLLFTGCSRAKRQLTLVGRRADIESVAAHVAPPRHSTVLNFVAAAREQ